MSHYYVVLFIYHLIYLHSLAPSEDSALFLFLDLANTLDILPQVPPRPLRAPSVVPEVLGGNLRATAPGPSESTGEPSCSTDLREGKVCF